jgi:uncharacterized RDD family membrane protein YckC
MSNADRYILETPENIEVEFELAGLGSRFCAMFIDTLVISLVVLVMVLLLFVPGILSAPVLTNSAPGSGRLIEWLVALVWVIVAVVVFDGYFLFFELVMRGQTPGKRAMKLRVIRDDGTPATLNEILVRNILRVVDFLPAGYAVGAVAMFFSPLCKRLGDVAAGTIVVKEGQLDYRASADKKYPLSSTAVAVPNSELSPEERRVLTGFLKRRAELLPDARAALAERLAKPLYEKYGGQYRDAESYVQRLVEGRHYES